MSEKKSFQQLELENIELRARLTEMENILTAIRAGQIDALTLPDKPGQTLYALQDTEQVYRLFVEEMNQGAVTAASDGTILYCNHYFANLLQLPLEKILGANLLGWVARQDRAEFASLLQPSNGSGRRTEIELRQDNTLVPVLVSAHSFSTNEIMLTGLLISDLTETKAQTVRLQEALEASKQSRQNLLSVIQDQQLAQMRLHQNERELQRFLNSSPDTIYILDMLAHRSRFLNRDEFLGYTKSELETTGAITAAVHPQDRESLAKAWTAITQSTEDHPISLEYRARSKAAKAAAADRKARGIVPGFLKHKKAGKKASQP